MCFSGGLAVLALSMPAAADDTDTGVSETDTDTGEAPPEDDTESQADTGEADTPDPGSGDIDEAADTGAPPEEGIDETASGEPQEDTFEETEESAPGETEEEDLEETLSEELSPMDLSLEQLLDTPVEVWTATKTAENIEKAPAIIEVVTGEDMQKWGYTTVAEALQHMLGFYIVDNHTLPNVSVRGVSGVSGSESGLIKVMINGRSVAFRAASANWLGLELIPWSAVQRIEVIRGPASALYGADAFLATVNVVLKKPEELNGAVIHGVLGNETDNFNRDTNFGTVDSRFDVSGGTKIKDFGLLVSFAAERGERNGLELPDTSPAPTIPNYNDDETMARGLRHESRVWYAQLSYEKELGSVVLSAYSSTIDRGGDFIQYSQLSEGRDHLGRSNGSRINLQHHVIGLDGRLNVHETLTLSLNASFFSGKPLPEDRLEVASDLYYIRRNFSYKGFNTVLEGLWQPLEPLDIVAGFELVYDDETLPEPDRVSKLTGEVLDSVSDDGHTKLFLNPGVYLQANWTAVPDFLKLTGGFRYDHHNVYGEQFTGRAGSVFLWTKNFTTKLLYGSAFKAPSPQLLYAVPIAPGDVIGNPDLKPQYVHTLELAPALGVTKFLTLRTTFAYNIILNKAEFIPQGINRTAANVAEVHGLSSETAANFKYEDIVNGYVSFEWQRVIRKLGQEGYQANLVGQDNIISPPWIVRAGVSGRLPFLEPVPVHLGIQGMVVAKRRASGENIVENGASYTLPVYGLLGASLQIPKLKILPVGETSFAIRAYNLLDAKGPDPGFAGVDYPLLPRRVMAEMVQTF